MTCMFFRREVRTVYLGLGKADKAGRGACKVHMHPCCVAELDLVVRELTCTVVPSAPSVPFPVHAFPTPLPLESV